MTVQDKPQKSKEAAKVHDLWGKVKWFDAKHAYGFVTPDNPEHGDVFVHGKDFHRAGYRTRNASIEVGDRCHLQAVECPRGLRAVRVLEISREVRS